MFFLPIYAAFGAVSPFAVSTCATALKSSSLPTSRLQVVLPVQVVAVNSVKYIAAMSCQMHLAAESCKEKKKPNKTPMPLGVFKRPHTDCGVPVAIMQWMVASV